MVADPGSAVRGKRERCAATSGAAVPIAAPIRFGDLERAVIALANAMP
jgi:hypothetical protein